MEQSILYREILEARPWVVNFDPEVQIETRYPTFPLHELLQGVATRHPKKDAIWFYGTKITFWDLFLASNRFAHALIGLGLKKGDRIGLMLPNSPQFNFAYWGGLSAGGVIVNLNPLSTVSELETMVKKVGLTALVTFDGILPVIKEVTSKVEIPLVIVTSLNDRIPGKARASAASLGIEELHWYHLDTLIDASKKDFRPHVAVDRTDPAVIQFTGGTTGSPKGATLTHANVVAGVYIFADQSAPIVQDVPVERRRVLCILPFTHIFGQLGMMAYSVKNAATQIILPRFDIEETMNTIGLFDEFMYMGAVPTMLNAMVRHPKARDLDVGRRFAFIGCGAAPCPPELIERCRDLNVNFVEGWGMSETCSTGVTTPVMAKKKIGSIGIPSACSDIRLVDRATGEDVKGEPHRVGELAIRSPVVMKGYWNDPDETRNSIRDGWLYTGDLAYRDEDWYVFLVDRSKDMIISGGYNVYPSEIDKTIFAHPKVLDVMCVGIPDSHWGECLKAFVVVKPDATATEEEILSWCREKLSAYKIPKQVEFRKSVPRTPVGKPLRRLLRDEERAATRI